MQETLAILGPVALLVVVVLVLRHQSSRFQACLRAAADRTGGHLEPSPAIALPRLVIPLDAARIQVSGVWGNRQGRRASTFARIACDGCPEVPLQLVRRPARVGVLERLGKAELATGDGDFDRTHWIQVDGAGLAAELLDAEVRSCLAGFEPRAAVRVLLGAGSVYRDGWMAAGELENRLEVRVRGLTPTPADLERMVTLLRRSHERLLRPALRRSA